MNTLSTDKNCISSAECLLKNEYTQVMRYYAEKTGYNKVILLSEAEILAENNIKMAAFYQEAHNKSKHFSYSLGKRAGNYAGLYANAMRQPSSTIIFSVDYETNLSTVNNKISDFFKGVKEGLNEIKETLNSTSIYEIGVYGSGLTCKNLKDKGLVSLTMLSGSIGHRGSEEYFNSSKWDIKQWCNEPFRSANCPNYLELCDLKKDCEKCDIQHNGHNCFFFPSDELMFETKNLPVLKKGSIGKENSLYIRLLEQLLNSHLRHFYFNTKNIASRFKGRHKKQVLEFQKSYNLHIDGIVGQETWNKLLSSI